MSKYRVCSTDGCKVRMPDLAFDRHTRCQTCVGKACSFDDHCEECASWSNEDFDRFVKHRHTLELTRLRKAKQRAKAKLSTSAGNFQTAVTGAAHSVSPSPSRSVVSLSPSSSVSVYSPSSSLPILLPTNSPAADSSAPQGQVVTRSEFDNLKNLMLSMATDLAAIRKDSGQAHSDSVPPPSQSVSLNPVVDVSDRDPAVHRPEPLLVEGKAVPSGESCPTGSCPMIQMETSSDLDRGRKRVREPKDTAERRKRKRSPSRERAATPPRAHDELRHPSTFAAQLSRENPSDLAAVSAPVPQNVDSRAQADGTFSDSMMANLEAFVASSMQKNSSLTLPQAVVEAKEFIKRTDPHNTSYTSARSSRGASVHERSVSALADVPGTPMASDLSFMKGEGCVQEGGSNLDARSHSLGHSQARIGQSTGFSRTFDLSASVGQCATSTPLKHGLDKLKHASHEGSTTFRKADFVTPRVKPSQLGSVRAETADVFARDTRTPVRERSTPCKGNISVEFIPHKELIPSNSGLSHSAVRPSSVLPQPTRSHSISCSPRVFNTSIVFSPKDKPSAGTQSRVQPLTSRTVNPSLSVNTGPSVDIQPVKRVLSWTPIDVFEFAPVGKLDQGTSAKPITFNKSEFTEFCGTDQGIQCQHLVVDQGTSPPSLISFAPEPPALAVTQGNSVSSSPGQPGPSVGTATQGHSSFSVSASAPSARQSRHDDDSDQDSEDESVVLADPSDPETVLLSASEAYALLKDKIVSKYPEIKEESKVVERSSFQVAFEKEKPQTSSFRMTPSVKLRFAAIDEELKKKKASSSNVTVLAPFLKKRDFRYYATDLSPEFEAQASVLASMAGVLDQTRVKRMKTTKVSFKMTELDSIFKSAFRALEIWSYASSSFEVLGDCFLDLRSKLPQEYKELAIQYASLLRCIDKAGRHGIGETVNIVTNLLLKKREHVMGMSNFSVPLSTKTDVIFSPVSSCKLLPPEIVKATTSQFRLQTETSALVAVAAASKASTSKSLFRTAEYGKFFSSPLQNRFRGGRSRGIGKASKKLYLRNREYFYKRDRFYRGRGQAKKSQPSTSTSTPNQ